MRHRSYPIQARANLRNAPATCGGRAAVSVSPTDAVVNSLAKASIDAMHRSRPTERRQRIRRNEPRCSVEPARGDPGATAKEKNGAEYGGRTRDIQLGKLALYQLS